MQIKGSHDSTKWMTRKLLEDKIIGHIKRKWRRGTILTTFAGEGWGQFSQIDCVISSGRQENELHVMGRKSSRDISSELRRLVFSPIFCCTCLSQTKSPRSLPGSRLNNRLWVVGSSKWHRGEKRVNYTFEYSWGATTQPTTTSIKLSQLSSRASTTSGGKNGTNKTPTISQ